MVLVLARLILLAVLGRRTQTPNPHATSERASIGADSTGGPWFEVRIIEPRGARPFFGLVPDGLFGLPPVPLTVHGSFRAAPRRRP